MKTQIAHSLAGFLVIIFIALGFVSLAAQATNEGLSPTRVTAGEAHTCALTPAGNARCWGSNLSGQAPASATGPFTEITAGGISTCALTSSGNVQCWGANDYGQAPASVTGPFTQITAGAYHTCALTSAGNAQCWGDNSVGAAPASVTGPFTQITAGAYHTCAVTSAGNAQCWGDNAYGQALASVTGPFTQITADSFHTCALTLAGNARCWGSNLYGQAPASATGPFTQITAGGIFTCALTPSGNVQCWGASDYGQAPESMIGPFAQITAGTGHTCALTPTGDARCWGDNGSGQSIPSSAMIYGTGFEPPTFSLAPISGQAGWLGDGVIQRAVSYDFVQALKVDATTGALRSANLPLSYTIGNSPVSVRVKLQQPEPGTAPTGIALYGDTGVLARIQSNGGEVVFENANSNTAPPAYHPDFCQSVAGTLNIHWQAVAGPSTGCTGIESTDGTRADAADGSITMSGIGVSNSSCIGTASYSFQLTLLGNKLVGSDTSFAVPMTLTRGPGQACFVGTWTVGPDVFEAYISAEPFGVATWHDLTIDLDFQSSTMNGYVDGQFLGSLAINPPSPATRLTELHLYSDASGTTAQSVYFDDVSLSTPVPLPEPSSALLSGTIGLAALAIVRRSGWLTRESRRIQPFDRARRPAT